MGPCVVGGLVGHQESESLDTQLLSSEIRNSYVFNANVELRHADTNCGNWINDSVHAGGLVGLNDTARVINSYVGNETRAFRDSDPTNTLSVGLAPCRPLRVCPDDTRDRTITHSDFSVIGVDTPIPRNYYGRIDGFAGDNNGEIDDSYWDYTNYECSLQESGSFFITYL